MENLEQIEDAIKIEMQNEIHIEDYVSTNQHMPRALAISSALEKVCNYSFENDDDALVYFSHATEEEAHKYFLDIIIPNLKKGINTGEVAKQ